MLSKRVSKPVSYAKTEGFHLENTEYSYRRSYSSLAVL